MTADERPQLASGSREFNRRRALAAEAELASARAELEQLRALNPPDERSNP